MGMSDTDAAAYARNEQAAFKTENAGSNGVDLREMDLSEADLELGNKTVQFFAQNPNWNFQNDSHWNPQLQNVNDGLNDDQYYGMYSPVDGDYSPLNTINNYSNENSLTDVGNMMLGTAGVLWIVDGPFLPFGDIGSAIATVGAGVAFGAAYIMSTNQSTTETQGGYSPIYENPGTTETDTENPPMVPDGLSGTESTEFPDSQDDASNTETYPSDETDPADNVFDNPVNDFDGLDDGLFESINQMNEEIKKGQAPGTISRVDKGNPDLYEKPHVHFEDGNALNFDGTWKHGEKDLTNKEKKWLIEHDWQIPQ